MSRQSEFKQRYDAARSALKARYGSGLYSWAEGVTRRAARRIARRLARKPLQPPKIQPNKEAQ